MSLVAVAALAAPTPNAEVALLQAGEHEEGSWPPLYLIGAQKSATTSLFNLFDNHGLICGRHHKSGMEEKEAHFFDQDAATDSAVHRYKEYYPKGHCKGKYMDATPAYLRDIEAPARMSRAMPNSVIKSTNLIAILREPVSRDLSFFNMFKYMWVQAGSPKHWDGSMGNENQLDKCMKHGLDGKFPTYEVSIGCQMRQWNECTKKAGCHGECNHEENLEAHKHCALYNGANSPDYSRLTDGMYFAQLRKYEEVFPREHTMVLSFDGLIDHQAKYLEMIMKFSGLGSHHGINSLPKDNTASFKGKVSAPSCGTVDHLHDVFKFWNHALDEKMKKDHNQGKAPGHEPEFVAFGRPKCSKHETNDD